MTYLQKCSSKKLRLSKQRGLVFVTLLLLVSACVKEKKAITQTEKVWNLDIENADTLLRHYIDSITFLPLEDKADAMLYGVDKFVVRNGLFYLADFRAGKIVAYDAEGHLKFVLASRGGGPKEYLEIKSFAVDSSFIYVVDNYRHKVLVYNGKNGQYERTLNLPFVVWDMEILPDGNFIFAYIPYKDGTPNIKQDKYKIFITDNELNVLNKLFEYKEGQFDFIGRPCYFTSSEQGVVFTSASSDNLYLFAGKDSVRQIEVKFRKGIPEQQRQNLELIDENGYNYWANTPIWYKDYIIFMVSHDGFLFDYVYNTENGQLSKNDSVNAYKGLLTPVGTDGKHLFSYLNDYLTYQELIEHGFTRADKEAEQHLEHEGALLVVYTWH